MERTASNNTLPSSPPGQEGRYRLAGTGWLTGTVASISLLLLTLLLFIPQTATAQNEPFNDPRFSAAVEHFSQAEFRQAQESLESLTADPSISGLLKQRTYKLLAQVYLIRRDYESARAAMRVWIKSEPPPVTADPDRDMPAFVKLYYEVRKSINKELYCPADFVAPDPCQYAVQLDPGVKTVAVIDFENLSVDDPKRLAPMSRALAHIVLEQLQTADRLIVVERELLGLLLNELDLNQTDAVDPATAVRIGEILGAHSILAGHFMHLNGRLDIRTRLIEVETSRILLATSEHGRLKNFQKIALGLTQKIVAALDTKIAQGALEGDSTWTNELEALLKTSEGNDFFDRGELVEAREKYEEALEHDPNYGLARQMLEAVNLAIAGEAQ